MKKKKRVLPATMTIHQWENFLEGEKRCKTCFRVVPEDNAKLLGSNCAGRPPTPLVAGGYVGPNLRHAKRIK